jgi:hypothetical protein
LLLACLERVQRRRQPLTSHVTRRTPFTRLIPLPQVTSDYRILDWNLMAKSGYVVTVVVIGFLLVGAAHHNLYHNHHQSAPPPGTTITLLASTRPLEA